jgi:hypothetical protein
MKNTLIFKIPSNTLSTEEKQDTQIEKSDQILDKLDQILEVLNAILEK